MDTRLSSLIIWPERELVQKNYALVNYGLSVPSIIDCFEIFIEKRTSIRSSQEMVLADRGFNVNESVAFRGATLDIPAFTRGKAQL